MDGCHLIRRCNLRTDFKPTQTTIYDAAGVLVFNGTATEIITPSFMYGYLQRTQTNHEMITSRGDKLEITSLIGSRRSTFTGSVLCRMCNGYIGHPRIIYIHGPAGMQTNIIAAVGDNYETFAYKNRAYYVYSDGLPGIVHESEHVVIMNVKSRDSMGWTPHYVPFESCVYGIYRLGLRSAYLRIWDDRSGFGEPHAITKLHFPCNPRVVTLTDYTMLMHDDTYPSPRMITRHELPLSSAVIDVRNMDTYMVEPSDVHISIAGGTKDRVLSFVQL